MKCLLDTNVLLWYVAGDSRLPEIIRDTIDRPESAIYVSTAPLWEIAIKYSIKRLELKPDLNTFLNKYVLNGCFQMLPIEVRHALRVAELPFHHRDPFDRLLISQSQIEGLKLLYTDSTFDLYMT